MGDKMGDTRVSGMTEASAPLDPELVSLIEAAERATKEREDARVAAHEAEAHYNQTHQKAYEADCAVHDYIKRLREAIRAAL
jgi:hypothetical protein